jgi:hypothetical protein
MGGGIELPSFFKNRSPDHSSLWGVVVLTIAPRRCFSSWN